MGGQLGWFTVPAGLQYAWGHGHEMIFGFALLVIAGYLAGPQPKTYIFTVMGLWLVARLSFWVAPISMVTAIINNVFVATLVWKLAPIFLRTAKKWRKKSAGFVLVGLGISALGFHMVMQSD
ncbi:NnrS family protein [Psychrobacter sp. Sa4CVA2]|uniref:NnrS family protein n=1 Tax=Psychrobacter communis TaxID=2762238 RepID=A0ABR8RHM9_9GAMM|nr:NnrS family protein [Psychrobacter communis]